MNTQIEFRILKITVKKNAADQAPMAATMSLEWEHPLRRYHG